MRAIVLASFMGGFVAGEGSFFATRRRDRKVFTFAVALGATDAETCVLLHAFFGCGSIVRSARRQAHFDDEVRYQVRNRADLLATIVPFMDDHLPASYKRTQYERWRAELLDYDRRPASRRATRAPPTWR